MVNTIQSISEDDDFYIQNMVDVYKNFISKNLKMLQPSISIVLGVGTNYAKGYKDVQEFSEDVESIVKFSIENNCPAFINIDDPKLSKYVEYDNVISLSLKNKQADYYLSHKRTGKYINVAIHSNINKDVINIRVLKVYERSLICILAAYAVAMHLGFTEYELLESNISNTGMLKETQALEASTTWTFDSESRSIKIQWADFNEFTGYHIRCYDESGRFVKGMHVHEGNEYEFANLEPDTKYIIKVRGYAISDKVKLYGAYMSKEISTKVMDAKLNTNVQTKPWLKLKKRIKSIFK